jgi:hypothetical protein
MILATAGGGSGGSGLFCSKYHCGRDISGSCSRSLGTMKPAYLTDITGACDGSNKGMCQKKYGHVPDVVKIIVACGRKLRDMWMHVLGRFITLSISLYIYTSI